MAAASAFAAAADVLVKSTWKLRQNVTDSLKKPTPIQHRLHRVSISAALPQVLRAHPCRGAWGLLLDETCLSPGMTTWQGRLSCSSVDLGVRFKTRCLDILRGGFSASDLTCCLFPKSFKSTDLWGLLKKK